MAPKEAKAAKAKKEEKPVAEGADAAAPETNVKPPRPDEESFKAKLDAVTEQIDKRKEEMKKLTQKIEERSQGKEQYDADRQALYNDMNTVKSERDQLIEQKKEMLQGNRQKQQEAKENKKALDSLQKTVSNLTEEGIDKEIQMIEYKIQTQSMPLKEEKALMMQIKKLKAQRPMAQKNLKEFEAMKAKVETGTDDNKTEKETFEELLNSLEEQIKDKKQKHEDYYTQIKTLKETRDKALEGVKDFIEKKKALKAQIDELFVQRTSIHEEKRAQQKAFNQWEQAERKKKQQRAEEERMKWEAEAQAERARKELEQPNPYLNETTLLEQTIDYCKGMLPKDDSAVEEEKKDLASLAPAAGARVLLSKKDRETEMYFTATKKKNLKKKAEKKGVAIKHTAETFAVFEQLKVKAPLTVDDIPSLLESLEKSLAGYMEKVKVWEADRQKKVEAAKANETSAQSTTADE